MPYIQYTHLIPIALASAHTHVSTHKTFKDNKDNNRVLTSGIYPWVYKRGQEEG